MVRVKVCGITRKEDALAAARFGFHALGFIFAPGPRQVPPGVAAEIIRSLPPMMTTVGVFVDEPPSFVDSMIHFCGLDLVQFHGPQTPDMCARFMPRSIKSVHLKDRESLSYAASYKGSVRALHFDTHTSGGGGGTGIPCDWSLARDGAALGLPVVLAGGLGPTNAADAVRAVSPWAVDVNSGVEERPGVKSHALMRELSINLEKCGKEFRI